MNAIETRKYRRISKAKARRLYNEGTDILVVPCKVDPENMWGLGVTTSIDYWDHQEFEAFLNEFVWYNCCNELGNYAAFYEERIKSST